MSATEATPNVKRSVTKTTTPAMLEGANDLKHLNASLDAILDRCKRNGYSSDELLFVFSPLRMSLNQHGQYPISKISRQMIIAHFFTSFALCFGCGVLFLFWHPHLTGWGALYYNAIASGLISKDFLVRNFGNGCFLSNPFYEPPQAYRPRPEDCYLCETVNSVEKLSGVNFESVKVNYLDRGRPLIVTDAMDDWDSMRLGVGVQDVAKLFLSPDLVSVTPCYLDTNLILRSALDMKEFLNIQKYIYGRHLDKWFIQWQNCKMEAVRKLRLLYRRMVFWDPSVSPEHTSWLIMSTNYTGRNYKPLDLSKGLIVLYQMQGSLEFSLIPHYVCYEDRTCDHVTGKLLQGQVLIFTNLLWNLEYLPYSVNCTSVSILTETFWN